MGGDTLMKWERGRQGTGYFKMKLLEGSSWDMYLLKFPKDSYIDEHTDPVEGKEHHRINVYLKDDLYGGHFWKNGDIVPAHWFHYFRPDIEPHRVSRVTHTTRYVLSIGWVK